MTWVDKDVRVLSRKHISRELRVFLIFICGKTLTFLLLVLVQIELLLSAPENLGGGEPLSFDWKRSSCNDDYDDDYDYPAMMIMTMCVTPLYPLHNPMLCLGHTSSRSPTRNRGLEAPWTSGFHIIHKTPHLHHHIISSS